MFILLNLFTHLFFSLLEPEYRNPEPKSYIAVASGLKQHNMAKVYAGYFRK